MKILVNISNCITKRTSCDVRVYNFLCFSCTKYSGAVGPDRLIHGFLLLMSPAFTPKLVDKVGILTPTLNTYDQGSHQLQQLCYNATHVESFSPMVPRFIWKKASLL